MGVFFCVKDQEKDTDDFDSVTGVDLPYVSLIRACQWVAAGAVFNPISYLGYR
jgi:hypothetical protein